MKNIIIKTLSILAVTFLHCSSVNALIITSVPINKSSWELFGETPSGVWQETPDGLRIFSSPGFRKGASIESSQHFDITTEDTTIYFKWKPNGGTNNRYMAVGPGIRWLNTDTQNKQRAIDVYTTSHSFAGSTVVSSPNTWYYTTFDVNNTDQEIVMRTATGNYMDNGGALLRSTTRDLSAFWTYFDDIQLYSVLWDTHAGTTANITLAEAGFSSDFSTSSVPIPAAVWLFGSATMILLRTGRKQKK